jgi:hypothetical protein
MWVLLLVLGLLVTAVGAVTTGFGIPINEFAVGQTLIIAGATVIVGGILLIGLGFVVAELARIAELLRKGVPARTAAAARVEPQMRHQEAPVIQPPRAAEPQPAPEPGVEVSASAIERLRATMVRPEKVVAETEEVPLSPNGGHRAPEPVVEQPAPAPARAAATAGEPKEARLDFLFRPRSQRPAQPENFDALWPKRPGREAQAQQAQARGDEQVVKARGDELIARAPVAERPAASAPPAVEVQRTVSAPPMDEARQAAILKSGVVDGMAYTLYADGSIEAQLPQGTVRFGSIAELRAHIENNS